MTPGGGTPNIGRAFVAIASTGGNEERFRGNIGRNGKQLAMPIEQYALDAAIDEIRLRYGTEAVTRAVLLGRRPGWTMPLLPD